MFLRDDPPLTKRQLGWIITTLGGLAALALLLSDLINPGQFNGLGSAQWLALGGAALVILIGLSLLPLGNRPA
jgi:hypothetical protein